MLLPQVLQLLFSGSVTRKFPIHQIYETTSLLLHADSTWTNADDKSVTKGINQNHGLVMVDLICRKMHLDCISSNSFVVKFKRS